MNRAARTRAALISRLEIAMNHQPPRLRLAACLLSLAGLCLSACSRQDAQGPARPATQAATSDAAVQGERVLYYYDPMRPEVHFDKPGPSPFMDMQLVPRMAEPGTGKGVAVEASLQQSLGLRTAKPSRQSPRPQARVPAKVVADAGGQARLESRVSGWVERLNVRAAGQSVSAGQVFAEIYSPELVQAQEEMLVGGEASAAGAERLRRLGIAEVDIQAVRKAGHSLRRLPLRTPASGVVTELGVREGSSVAPGGLVADISSRGAVWVEAAVFPAQRLRLGESISARFSLPGLPGREWTAASGRLLPLTDPVTQTLSLRFSISDAGDLPLGTVLDAELLGTARENLLVIPADAVIRTAAGDRVLVRQGQRFLPVAVLVGERFGSQVEIREGLGMADEVVVSGQFLLDAEASLAEGLDRMGASDAAPAKEAQP
jgi:Cu(I)/Ag(I) efflux system membrane fusion protein